MIKLINADCLDFVKTIEDNSIDCILTDPPYGDGMGYGRMSKTILNNEDESINYKIIPELERVIKDGGVIYIFTNWKFCGRLQNFIEEQTNLYQRTILVIVKNNIGMGYGFRNQHELCLVLEKGKHKYTNRGFSNVISMQHISHNIKTHPHEKGVLMLEKMIEHATIEGETILDCFMGSGSVGVACKNTNRNFIGIELDKEYYKLAEERLK